MAAKKPENMSFEEILKALESILNDLETGDLPLDSSLKLFERGVMLSRHGQKSLADAEQRVEILLAQDDTTTLSPFEDSRDDK